MKNTIEYCIYLSELDYLENLEDTLKIVPHPGPEFLEIMDVNTKTNQVSSVKLRDALYKKEGIHYADHFSRLYFGNEICEVLIPSLKIAKRAYEIAQEREMGFTLVTPYVAFEGVEKLKELFEYFNQFKDVEVVVNDYGILHILSTTYKNIIPVIGRLLVKMKRDPRFSVSGFDRARKLIKDASKVEKNQEKALSSSGLELESYQKLLAGIGVKRVSIDALPTIPDKTILKKWGFPIDVYWPWVYITSGRSCAIAAHTQPGKLYHPTDEPCYKQCKLFEFIFESDKSMMQTVQRGKAVWMNTFSLFDDYYDLSPGRLVYQPYIPV
jgi:hypothetical protein